MTGIQVDFTGTSPVFGTSVSGFQCVVQNALVGLGTAQGTDPVYPDRGTNLQKDAAVGRLIDLHSAQHASNFAALDVLAFSRETEAGDPSGLAQVLLSPAEFSGNGLQLEAKFLSIDGKSVGITVNI